MFKNLDIRHHNINRVGKEITTYEYTLQAGQVPVEIKIDWEGAWLQATYGKVFCGDIIVWHSQLFHNGTYTTIYANRGGCTSIENNKIYFRLIGRPDFHASHFTIQSATPIIPEPNSFSSVITLACPGEEEDYGSAIGFYAGGGRVVYVMEVWDDITQQFVQQLESKLLYSGHFYLDGMIDGVAVFCDCNPDIREGKAFGLEIAKAQYPEDIESSTDESLEALDIYANTNSVQITHTEKIRYIRTRANVQTVAQAIANIITQNAWLRGTVITNPSDTYYSIIESAAKQALWNIESVII